MSIFFLGLVGLLLTSASAPLCKGRASFLQVFFTESGVPLRKYRLRETARGAEIGRVSRALFEPFTEYVAPLDFHDHVTDDLSRINNSVPHFVIVKKLRLKRERRLTFGSRNRYTNCRLNYVDFGRCPNRSVLSFPNADAPIPADFPCGGLTRIAHVDLHKKQAALLQFNDNRTDADVASHLSFTDAPRLGYRTFGSPGPPLSLSCGFSGIVSGGTGSGEREKPYGQPSYTKVEGAFRPDNAVSRSIRSFPLGAKIGLTIILALGASGVWCVGFIALFERRSVLRILSYASLGLGFMLAGAVPWW